MLRLKPLKVIAPSLYGRMREILRTTWLICTNSPLFTRGLAAAACVVIITIPISCERRTAASTSPFQQETCEYVLLVAIDVSGSFHDQMAEKGKAFTFILDAVEQYFRDRVGSNDQIVITQLSGSNQPLLWQGTPHQLMREFDSRSFRTLLMSRAEPGSRINAGLVESIDYVLNMHSIANGDAKTVALVISDMEDSDSDNIVTEMKLIDALKRFARRGGIGFYFCNQRRIAEIRDTMRKAGFKWFTVEPDFAGNPPLPSFE